MELKTLHFIFLGLLMMTCFQKAFSVCVDTLVNQPLLSHSLLIPENITTFPNQTEYYNNSLITNMFRENGLNRKCHTWQKDPPDCNLNLRCHMYACVRHLDAQDSQDDTALLNSENAFVLELYGYDDGSLGAYTWVSMTFAKHNASPPTNALQIACFRRNHHDIVPYVYYIDPTGNPQIIDPYDDFLKIDYGIGSTENPEVNHIYCELHIKQQFTVPGSNPPMEFDCSNFYYPMITIGGRANANDQPILGDNCIAIPPDRSIEIYRPYEATTPKQVLLICIHASIAVFVFVVLVPSAMFPVRYHKLALNDTNEYLKIKNWFCIHLKYAVFVYPLLLISILFARYARSGTYPFISYTNSTTFSYVHGNLGVVCFQMYSVEFLIGLFSYKALLSDENPILRAFHKIIHYASYVLAIHILWTIRLANELNGSNRMYFTTFMVFICFQTLIHFIMKFFDSFALQQYDLSESDHYLEEVGLAEQLKRWDKHSDHVMLDSFWEKPPNIQKSKFETLYVSMEYVHLCGCLIFAATLIFYVADKDRYYPASWRNTFRFRYLGELTVDPGRLAPWMYV